MEVPAERPQLPAAVPDGGGRLRGSSGCHGDQPDESGGGNGQAGGAGERGAQQGVPGPVSRESYSACTPQTLPEAHSARTPQTLPEAHSARTPQTLPEAHSAYTPQTLPESHSNCTRSSNAPLPLLPSTCTPLPSSVCLSHGVVVGGDGGCHG